MPSDLIAKAKRLAKRKYTPDNIRDIEEIFGSSPEVAAALLRAVELLTCPDKNECLHGRCKVCHYLREIGADDV